ncbi:hypothetical protein C8R45DRAFT_1092153 [Mycena sanguinolenta]|nr:hypothetical protein C8R45DRAFT_1092153 [Mycena sanguinolenta]
MAISHPADCVQHSCLGFCLRMCLFFSSGAQHNNAQSLNTSNFESIRFFFEFPGAIHTNTQHRHPSNPEILGLVFATPSSPT